MKNAYVKTINTLASIENIEDMKARDVMGNFFFNLTLSELLKREFRITNIEKVSKSAYCIFATKNLLTPYGVLEFRFSLTVQNGKIISKIGSTNTLKNILDGRTKEVIVESTFYELAHKCKDKPNVKIMEICTGILYAECFKRMSNIIVESVEREHDKFLGKAQRFMKTK